MTALILPRRLSYRDGSRSTHILNEDELLARLEPLVILGEAGMGKTTLLGELAKAPDTALVSARRLANALDPQPLLGDAKILIIDALDEAAGAKDGDAVDQVLARLDLLGHPRFVLACREADWRSVTGLAAIQDAYGDLPLELRLLALEADDARRLLANRFGEERAGTIVAHFEERGLADLFGNPQTLSLIETVAGTCDLPDTRVGLFEAAIDIMWAEHSPMKQDSALAQLGRDTVLDAAGAAFATLILSNQEALTRVSSLLARPYDLPIAEIDDAALFQVLGSRLFKPLGGERWTYQHRSIGEFLGARCLARRSDSARKRRRLRTLFNSEGLVPASLRGLHAWLARDVALAPWVIADDPMGVIEYGDADTLAPPLAAGLLEALIALERRNPRFGRWGTHHADALTCRALQPQVTALIASNETPFAVRMLLLQVIQSSPAIAAFADALGAIMLDEGVYYALRGEAGEALAKLAPDAQDWPARLETLRQRAREDSLRLAIELLTDVGLDQFDDEQIASLVAARAGLTLCSFPLQQESTFAGPFYRLERDLPPERLGGVLDALTEYTSSLLDRDGGYLDRAEITDVIFSLAARRVPLSDLDPLRLWSWLAPFEGMNGYHREPVDTLSAWFRANAEARRTIQKHVIFDRPGTDDLWHRSWHLQRVVPGLEPDDSDIAALLPALGAPARPTPEEIERWKALVGLVPHDAERGGAARDAARAFAGKRKRLHAWLDKRAEPFVPAYKVKHERRERKRREAREKRWLGHRDDYAKHVDKIRAGVFGFVQPLAQSYLKLFHDTGDELPAHERIAEWLGPDLQDAGFEGFEAFLSLSPPKPDAAEIATSHADAKAWNAEHIILAALAERLRTGRGFQDLPNERLAAGAIILRWTQLDDHAGIDGLAEAIEAELRARPGEWEAQWRLHLELQLEMRRTYVDGLHELMQTKADARLAADLAEEWLGTYADLPAEAETPLIDRLIGARRYEALRVLAATRLATGLNDERRRNWQVVDLLTDFEAAAMRLAGAGEREPALLWHLRYRLSNERDNDVYPVLSPGQLAWIVREFRSSWPYERRPTGTTTGDKHGWDASEFINRMISRLGEYITDEGIETLAALKAAPEDSYSDAIAIVAAEQAQIRAEEQFSPLAPGEVRAVLSDAPPESVTDLRAVILEELAALAARLKGNDTDSWTHFWDRGEPLVENLARDLAIDLLGPNLPFGITAAPEADMPGSKRADIGFASGNLRLPVEVKRHWHRDLWTAADTQLDRYYGRDHRAGGYGVYLVLWFGADRSRRMPRRPDGGPMPNTAAELEAALAEISLAARTDRVVICVLDVSRHDV